jgi:hypothetical protein
LFNVITTRRISLILNPWNFFMHVPQHCRHEQIKPITSTR